MLIAAHLKEKHPEVLNKIDIQIRTLRENGVPLSIPVIRGTMLGIIQNLCPQLLDGKVHKLPRSSVKHFMHSIGYSYRFATQSAKLTSKIWPELGRNMAIQIAQSIHAYHTPPELVINADQTGIHLLPSPNHTWDTCGNQQVQIIGKNEKHQVTLMMASTVSGGLLKSQVIVPGISHQSLPPPNKCLPFASSLQYFYSGGVKHWSNLQMMKLVSITLCNSL